MTADSKQPNKAPSRKLGARNVVELLRRNLDENLPEQFVVSENRHKNAVVSLVKLLTIFQSKIAKSPYTNASVRSLLANYLVQKKQLLHISQPDLGAITMIDDLFDQLLDSDKFDKDAWCLLAQIRLPITKCALQDYSFFFAGQNPGRRFLNSLTLNLLGAGDRETDDFRKAIGGFVDQINATYKEDVSAFNKVCIESQSWFADQQQRLVKIQAKLSEAESNRAQRNQAEPRVVELLNRVAGGNQLPDLLVDFLYGDWRDALRIVSMRDGEQSREWKRQVRLTESMVEMVSVCETPEGQEQYQKFLPPMLKNLRALIKPAFDDQDAIEKSLEPIELILNALVCGAKGELKEAPMLNVSQQLGKEYEILPELDVPVSKLQKLKEGDWLRLKTPSGAFEACKIAVKPESDDQPWALVNHSGKKIAKKNLVQLAKGLSDGVIEIVGEGRWVDDIVKSRFTELARIPAPKAPPKVHVSVQPAPQPTLEPVSPPQPKITPEAAPAPEPAVGKDSDSASSPPPDGEARKSDQNEASSLSVVSREDQSATTLSEQKDAPQAIEEILAHSQLSLADTATENEVSADSKPQPIEKTADEAVTVPSLAELEEALDPGEIPENPEDESDERWEDYVAEPRVLTEDELAAAQIAASQIGVGGWIVRIDEEGQETRCKLAVRMKANGKLIFVNRVGIKEFETNEPELAEFIAKGEVTIVDNGAQFDSALERVVMNIQADKKTS